MIVLIFGFFDLALDLVPLKFVIRRVLSMSEKCRLSFANPGFQVFRDPGTVSWVSLNYFSWKEGIHSRSKFHYQQPELVLIRLSIRNRVPVFSVIQRPSARHAVSRISRDSILVTGLCLDDNIGLAKMV